MCQCKSKQSKLNGKLSGSSNTLGVLTTFSASGSYPIQTFFCVPLMCNCLQFLCTLYWLSMFLKSSATQDRILLIDFFKSLLVTRTTHRVTVPNYNEPRCSPLQFGSDHSNFVVVIFHYKQRPVIHLPHRLLCLN